MLEHHVQCLGQSLFHFVKVVNIAAIFSCWRVGCVSKFLKRYISFLSIRMCTSTTNANVQNVVCMAELTILPMTILKSASISQCMLGFSEVSDDECS